MEVFRANRSESPAAPSAQALLAHLDDAFNLARWLTGNDADADDVVQDAYLRALRFAHGFQGENLRGWLLTIVRNAARDLLARSRRMPAELSDEQIDDQSDPPDDRLMRDGDVEIVRRALGQVPLEHREVLVLREMDGLSYKEIAQVVDLPIGTVMSRLSRARSELRRQIEKIAPEEAKS